METITKNRSLKRVGDFRVIWEFYRVDGWRWKQVDAHGNMYKASVQAYRHLLHCIASAKAEGYRAESQARFPGWAASTSP